MSETEPQHPLADKALAQLQKLADGNGLNPADIRLIKAEEKIYALEAVITLSPDSEVKTAHYPGRPQGKSGQIYPTVPAMHAAVDEKQRDFIANPGSWMKIAIEELKAQPGQGWGLNEASVILPNMSSKFAASAACPAASFGSTCVCASARICSRFSNRRRNS